MNRRDLIHASILGSMALAAPAVAAQGTLPTGAAKPRFVMLIHPKMVLLDLIPAMTVFQLTMGEVQLVAKTRQAVATDLGIDVTPTHTFAEAFKDPDVLCIPGGLQGTVACMRDSETLDFVKMTGNASRYVTSVCTGSLVLGAAGLLRGYRATGHWHSRYALAKLGAEVSSERVVIDRNRITGGGVTAGLDFGLTIAAALKGADYAKGTQLILEYAPQPPFEAGTPQTAENHIVARMSALLDPGIGELDDVVRSLVARGIS